MRVVVGAAMLACGLLGSTRATAGEPPLGPARGPVVWKREWRRFTPIEGAVTLAGTALGFLMERRLSEPSTARISGSFPLVDDTARFLFRGRTAKIQSSFAHYSDVGYRMMVFFPYADALVSALLIHRSPDVAAQMTLIDVEALTLSGITQLLVSRVAGRARPYVQDCGEDGQTLTRTCGLEGDHRSLYSGHTAATFTSAALTCLHHQFMPLYGGGAADAWACTWAVGVATATGLFRIASDSHYLTDVAIGAAAGWFYGYMMPRWLHYTARVKPAIAGFEPSFSPLPGGGMLGFGRRL